MNNGTQKHTPGKWTAKQDTANGNDRFILSGRNGAFGHWQGWAADGVTTEEEDAANARLIAAAPDLLEALEELTRIGCFGFDVSSLPETAPRRMAVEQARAAIRKARGE
jgi:hypothetical protein